MTHEEAKAIIGKIQSEKRNGDSDDLRGALKIFAEQLNTEATHFVWELIQNAEDNEYETCTPELRLQIDATDCTQTPAADGCLIVVNNEVGFQEKHVRGICSVGRSSKSRSELSDYIGEKGIGFKSVFRVSDSPHIFSNGFQFRFCKPRTPEELGYIVPEWVENIPPQAIFVRLLFVPIGSFIALIMRVVRSRWLGFGMGPGERQACSDETRQGEIPPIPQHESRHVRGMIVRGMISRDRFFPHSSDRHSSDNFQAGGNVNAGDVVNAILLVKTSPRA